MALFPGALFGVAGASADSGGDPQRLITGSIVYPKGSWAFDTEIEYGMTRYRDSSRDTFAQSFVVEHGLTRLLSLEAGFEARGRRRSDYAVDALSFGGRRAFAEGPVKTAVSAEYHPSLRRRADAFGLGLETMLNSGSWTFQAVFGGESEKEVGAARRLDAKAHLGAYRRFGLHGLLGQGWGYSSYRGHEAHVHLASAINERLFVSLEPKAGLSPRGRDFALDLLFSLYFGPYGMGEWLMQ